ncbi:hypothetical protein Hanom_Chr17g01580421 [Helianthus anomalus]
MPLSDPYHPFQMGYSIEDVLMSFVFQQEALMLRIQELERAQPPSIHRLRLGLLGYLIPFAPLAFVSQCQCRPSRMLSPLVFFPISTHFTAPPEIPSTPTVLQLGSFHRLSRVEPWDLTADLKSHLQTLYAQSFRITLASSVLPRMLAQS